MTQVSRGQRWKVPATPAAEEVTMTSAAYRSAGTGGRYAQGQGVGLVIFAAVLLGLAGFFNLIYGIAAIANSHVFVANAHYVFANLRT